MHGTVQWIFSTAACSSTSQQLAVDEITTESQVLTSFWPLQLSRWSNLAGVFFTWRSPRSVSSNVVLTLFPNSLPLLFVNDRNPPFAFLPLNQLIRAGFRTKSHLGKPTCQFRSIFTQKRHLLLNICLQGSKTFLLSPLNTLIFLSAYRFLFLLFVPTKLLSSR